MKTTSFPSFRRLIFSAAASFLALTLPASAAIAPAPTVEPYSVRISGHSAPIFFIPGLGTAGDVWAEVVKTLELTHECHVFTLAGFAGQAPVPGDFLTAMESALGDYLKVHSSSKPTLVGHSLGGLLALKISAKYPGLVSKLVVVDSLPFFAGAQPGATPEGARQYANGLRNMMENQPREAFLAGIRQGLPRLVKSEENQATVFRWMEASDQATVARAISDVTATDARADVARVTSPLLLIEAGAGPGAVPVELFTVQYSAAPLLTRVRIPEAQHFIMLDEPARFLKEVQVFLNSR